MKRAKYKPKYEGNTIWAHAYNNKWGMACEHPYKPARWAFFPERPIVRRYVSDQGLLEEVLLVEFNELEFEELDHRSEP